MFTTKINDSNCPVCGYELNRLSSITHEEKPRPGDCTVCLKCTSFLLITDTFGHALMSDKQIAELPGKIRYQLFHIRELINVSRTRKI